MNELLVSEDQLYEYLRRLDRFDESTRPLPVFHTASTEYRMHVDVNEQEDSYGYIYEWWIEGPDGYVDGGFVPANSDEEIRALARQVLNAIRLCMDRVAGRAQEGGPGA